MCQVMKRNRKPSLAVVAGACSLIAIASGQAMSSTESHKGCSNDTLQGSYGIQMQGTRPAGPGVTEAVIGVVMRYFDGRGGFEQVDNIKGSITGIVPDRPGYGSYQVNRDCTGSTTFQPDPNNPNLVIEERFVIVDDGNEMRSMSLSPAALMVTNVAKRVGKP